MKAFGAFVRRINLRHWARHRLRTALTVLGVTTGVTLVVAIAVINSTLLSTVEDTALALAGTADIEIAAADSTGLSTETLATVSEVDGVEAAIPVLRTYSRLDGPSGSRRVLILGTTYNFHDLFPNDGAGGSGIEISAGVLSHRGVLLADRTAASLGASAGDPLSAEVRDGSTNLTMAGTFSGPLVDALETGDIGVMPLHTAQNVFSRGGRVDSIYVIGDDDAGSAELTSAISEAVGPSAIVGSPGARAAGFEEALTGVATLTSLAGTVALFVSAFVVFNTMSMSIVERRREISLTLALGATRRQVIAGFVGEAAVLGIGASIIGCVAGTLLAQVMVQPGLDGLRVFTITAVAGATLEWFHVLLALVSGVVVSVVASYLPARRILKVAPVEALRPHGAHQALTPDGSKGKRQTMRWIAGISLLAVGTLFGIVTGSNPEDGAWTTNLALLALLAGTTFLLPMAVRVAIEILRRLLPRAAGVSARLAIDSLHREPGRTTVTIGALVFTLGIVIAVGGALDSYEAEWYRSARSWYGGPIQISSPSYVSLGSDQPLPASFEETLENTDGVGDAYAARYRVVNIDGRQTTIYVTPYIEQSQDPNVPAYGRGFRENVANVLEEGDVVISALSAREKGLEVGDTFAVPTPTGAVSFEVGGIVSDLNPLDAFFLSNETFLEHWQESAVDRFEVTIEPGSSQAQVMENVRDAARAGGIPVRVRTQQQLLSDIWDPIDQMFSVARAVQLCALIVAALAIANTMFITVLERRWELGLQRAVGMDGASVTKTLLAEAGTIGLIGGLGAWIVGLVTGYLMVGDMKRAYAFSFPFELPYDLMALTLVVGGVIALGAGAYPSRAALRTPIVEALRFE
ncbi:MAG: FtsX-like permease family protein [Actinomycetota bacterium]